MADRTRPRFCVPLPGYHENCIKQLLYLRVLCLSVPEDLANKVHMLLFDLRGGFWPFYEDDSANYCIHGCHV
jgi:hypothetical protein